MCGCRGLSPPLFFFQLLNIARRLWKKRLRYLSKKYFQYQFHLSNCIGSGIHWHRQRQAEEKVSFRAAGTRMSRRQSFPCSLIHAASQIILPAQARASWQSKIVEQVLCHLCNSFHRALSQPSRSCSWSRRVKKSYKVYGGGSPRNQLSYRP